MIVLLDTNFLLLPHQHGIDVFSEIERLVPEEHTLETFSNVVDELRGLVGYSKDGVAAKVALKLLAEKGVKVIPSDIEVDDAILEYAKKRGVIVGTNDQRLKAGLRALGVEILCMRGRDHLERI